MTQKVPQVSSWNLLCLNLSVYLQLQLLCWYKSPKILPHLKCTISVFPPPIHPIPSSLPTGVWVPQSGLPAEWCAGLDPYLPIQDPSTSMGPQTCPLAHMGPSTCTHLEPKHMCKPPSLVHQHTTSAYQSVALPPSTPGPHLPEAASPDPQKPSGWQWKKQAAQVVVVEEV